MADRSQTAHPQEKAPLSKHQIKPTHEKTLNEKCVWKMSSRLAYIKSPKALALVNSKLVRNT